MNLSPTNKVTLHTSTGEAAAEVEILTFDPPPDVLIWGIRVFNRRADGKYYECFAYIVPNIQDLRK